MTGGRGPCSQLLGQTAETTTRCRGRSPAADAAGELGAANNIHGQEHHERRLVNLGPCLSMEGVTNMVNCTVCVTSDQHKHMDVSSRWLGEHRALALATPVAAVRPYRCWCDAAAPSCLQPQHQQRCRLLLTLPAAAAQAVV
jgi:hypothetical protein